MNAITATPSPIEPDEIPVDEVRAALERVLSNGDFARNTNCTRILRFIVEETIEGRGARLKAFSIATLALNRPGDFNPQANSIVRVQAKRLRELLGQYYAGVGAVDSIVIHLPVGNYQPQFIRRPNRRGPTPTPAPAPAPILAPDSPAEDVAPPRRGLIKALICAAVALLALSALAVWEAHSTRQQDAEPIVAIAPQDLDVADGDLPVAFIAGLRRELAAFDPIRLAGPGARRRGAAHANYTIWTRFAHADANHWDASLTLVREPGGDVIWARQFDALDGRAPASLRGALDLAVRSIADTGVGAIFNDMRARLSATSGVLSGYGCYLEGQAFLRDRAPGQAQRARECLEATLSANPRDVAALTTLSMILTNRYLVTGDSDLFVRATRLAKRAFALEPKRADVQAAMFLASFYAGRIDEAFAFAETALKLNPNATLIAAEIAKAYVARGRPAEALALIRPIDEMNGVVFAAGSVTLTIASHMLGEDAAAYRYASRAGNSDTPLGLMARVIACHAHASLPCALAATEDLRRRFPAFAADISGALQRREMTDALRLQLLRDLESTGFFATAAE